MNAPEDREQELADRYLRGDLTTDELADFERFARSMTLNAPRRAPSRSACGTERSWSLMCSPVANLPDID